MIDPAVVRTQYVAPALTELGLYTADAERLLMGTAAVESNFTNFVQLTGGPGRGMFQMEDVTFYDIVDRLLARASKKALRQALYSLGSQQGSPGHPPPKPKWGEVTTNHLLAAGLARIKYSMVATPIPSGLEAQAEYWWTYYNGRSVHGLKPADYLDRWGIYCAPVYAKG